MTGEHDPWNAHACMTMQLITEMLPVTMLLFTVKRELMDPFFLFVLFLFYTSK